MKGTSRPNIMKFSNKDSDGDSFKFKHHSERIIERHFGMSILFDTLQMVHSLGHRIGTWKLIITKNNND